jgi:hypothetical protein
MQGDALRRQAMAFGQVGDDGLANGRAREVAVGLARDADDSDISDFCN